MRGRHLDCASTKVGIDRFIRDNRNLAPNHRKNGDTPDHICVARIPGIDCHSRITQDGFRASGGNADIFRLLFTGQRLQGIAHKGQRSQRINVVDFQVGERAHTARTPVDNALASIN